MTFLCWRRSITASSPAHSASADLPVPARPPSDTMPISGSSSRSSATRCSALRPRRPNASRSPRTSWTDLSGLTRPRALPLDEVRTRPVWQGRSRAGSHSKVPVSYSCSISPLPMSSSVLPVQPEPTGSSARYSCAASPTAAALTRSGRSLLTRTTSSPSAARLHATDKMRESLSPIRNPAGSTCGSEWLSSTCTVPPSAPTGSSASSLPCSMRRSSRCRRAWRAKYPSSGWFRLASSSVMTTIGRTTLCSSKRVIAAGSASRTLVSSTYVRRPWELTTQTPLGARTGPAPRQDTDVSDGPGVAPKRAAPALLSVRLHATRVARRSEGLPGNGAVPSTTIEGTRVPVTAKAPPRYEQVYEAATCDNASSAAEPAVPGGVGAQRPEEVHLAEGGPVGVAEIELGVGALPEQEAAEALLARGADDQVGVGLARRVEVLGDVLDVEHFGQFLDRGAPCGLLLQQGAHRVGDLPPPPVPHRHVDEQPGLVRGRVGRVLQHPDGVAGQQVERADRVHVPLLRHQALHGVLDDLQQRHQLGRGAGQVVGGQQPQGDHLDAALPAPVEQLEDLVRALAVAAADVAESRRLGPPAVPVAHHPDVPRDGVRRQCSGKPPLVEPVDQVTKSHAGGLPHHHDDPPETYLTGATPRF